MIAHSQNRVVLEDPIKQRCGASQVVFTEGLYNWGGDPKEHPMEADLAADANSLVIKAYMIVCDPADTDSILPASTHRSFGMTELGLTQATEDDHLLSNASVHYLLLRDSADTAVVKTLELNIDPVNTRVGVRKLLKISVLFAKNDALSLT